MHLQANESAVVMNNNIAMSSLRKDGQNPRRPFGLLFSPLPPPKQPLKQNDTDTTSVSSTSSITELRQDSAAVNNKKKSCLKVTTEVDSLQQTGFSLDVATSRDKDRQHVQFSSQVHVRVHNTIMSDHPGVSSGLPIGLGWEICLEFIMEQDTTEDACQQQRTTVPQEIMLPAWDRQRLLILQGYSQCELRQAERDIKTIQDSRRRNARSLLSWIQPVSWWYYRDHATRKKTIKSNHNNNNNFKSVVSLSNKHGRNKTTKGRVHGL
jgi:hypothetical protein